MFISQPPCGGACIFESLAASPGSRINTTAGAPADSQTATGVTCQSTGIEQTEQCNTSLIANSSQLQSPTSISNSTSEAHSTSLSSLLPRPEIGQLNMCFNRGCCQSSVLPHQQRKATCIGLCCSSRPACQHPSVRHAGVCC